MDYATHYSAVRVRIENDESNLTSKHLGQLLNRLIQMHGNMTRNNSIQNLIHEAISEDKWLPYAKRTELRNAVLVYTRNDIAMAHGYLVKEVYPNTKERAHKRGRPPGSTNKNKRNDYFDINNNNNNHNDVKAITSDLVREVATNDDVEIIEPTKEIKVETSHNPDQMTAMLAALLSGYVKTIEYNKDKTFFSGEIVDIKSAFKKTEFDYQEFKSHISSQIKTIQESKPIEVVIQNSNNEVVSRKEIGVQHKNFTRLLKTCNCRHKISQMRLNIWLYGPPGTGKSTAGENVAAALGLNFYTNGKLNAEHKVEGYNDAHSIYNSTQFREAFEFGGLYLADEIDGSYPDALLAFNAALANGFMTFPDNKKKPIRRHKDFIFVGAANTTGVGSSIEYVARFKQDAAFNDRFVFIDWPLDDNLESAMVDNKSWLERVRMVRRNVKAKGLKSHFITPRASMYGEMLLAGGLELSEVDEMVLRKGLDDAQWNMIKPAI